MNFGNKVVSLLFAAGLAATSCEANRSVGQGNLYGIGGQNFETIERMHSNPTLEQMDEDSSSTQINLTEELNPLPLGWSEHFDQSSGHYYYFNSLDGTTTWDRPTSTLENEKTSRYNTAHKTVERAEIQSSGSVTPSTRNDVSSQESQEDEDSPTGQQQTRDPRDVAMQQTESVKAENAVQCHPLNQRSQPGVILTPSDQMRNDDGDRLRWTQENVAPQQVEYRESLELSKDSKESAFGEVREQNVGRNQGYIESVSGENFDSAGNQENVGVRGSLQHSDVGIASEEQPRGGWGLPNHDTEGPRQKIAPQLQSSTFVRSGKNSESIPNSQFGRASQAQELRRAPSPEYHRIPAQSHQRPNPAYQSQQERPDRADQANVAAYGGQHEQFRENNASNGQSVSRHHFENGASALNSSRRSQPPNPPHSSRPDGRPPPLSQSQYPNSQNPQQRSHSIPSQAQYRTSQYPRQGSQRPLQHTNYNYNSQPEVYNQQSYNQQPSVGGAVTAALEDGTTAVKDVLGKSWEGLLGFSSRTREAMGQARDQVVTGASVAGHSISAKSTNWWGQAKSAFGSVFEKSDDTAQPQYNMSNQYGSQHQHRYPEGQTAQSYGQNPSAYPQPTRARGQVQNTRQQERQFPLDRHGVQGQQSQPQSGQIRRPGLQTRYDPPSPLHGQARPPPQSYQSQYQHPPRRHGLNQEDRPLDKRPQQLMQDKEADPWSHPGLAGDV